MRLFLCWSGKRGSAFALATKELLNSVLMGAVTPIVSMDIEKGSVWFEQLASELDGAAAGIVCISSDAVQSSWIHYEAGILSRAVRETARQEGDVVPVGMDAPDELLRGRRPRLFTLLLGVGGGELLGPLSAYQSTNAIVLEDVAHLLSAILTLLPEEVQVQCEGWREQLRQNWSIYEAALQGIPPADFPCIFPQFEKMFDRKTFNEPLHDCLNQDWTVRYAGVRETLLQLRMHEPEVKRSCRPYEVDILASLIRECSAYAMNLSLLLGRHEFQIDADGHVLVQPAGVAVACEQRRQRIKELVSWLAGGRRVPVLDESFRFLTSETFAERKTIIHRLEREIASQDETQGTEKGIRRGGKLLINSIEELDNSDWALDRVVAYLYREHSSVDCFSETRRAAQLELEKARSEHEPSLIPLHYSLRAIHKLLEKKTVPESELAKTRKLVERAAEVVGRNAGEESAPLEIQRLIVELSHALALN